MAKQHNSLTDYDNDIKAVRQAGEIDGRVAHQSTHLIPVMKSRAELASSTSMFNWAEGMT